MKIIITITIILLATCLLLLNLKDDTIDLGADFSVSEMMTNRDVTGYARAITPRSFIFPDDHGPHPEFKTEWWYYTGNLKTERGRHFGYQFTIFRNAISPDSIRRTSAWATNQIYMAHFTITDVIDKRFHYFERFSRGSVELAGANAKPFRIWLEDWIIDGTGSHPERTGKKIRIGAVENDVSIDILLEPLKPVVLQGDEGLSRKGPQAGNASYYYSMTRLKTNGVIQIGNLKHQVRGFSWMDHEWSTSALGKNQIGWDWFALQLDNNSEIMYYQIRRRDGGASEWSQGNIIEPDGKTYRILPENALLNVTEHWKSPLGDEYPSRWQLLIPDKQIDLKIQPYLNQQELDVSIRYWEGAVKIDGTIEGNPVKGNGYVELTGYADQNHIR